MIKEVLAGIVASTSLKNLLFELAKPKDSESRMMYLGYVSDFHACMEQGQTRLAVQALKGAGRVANAPPDFWHRLAACAQSLRIECNEGQA